MVSILIMVGEDGGQNRTSMASHGLPSVFYILKMLSYSLAWTIVIYLMYLGAWLERKGWSQVLLTSSSPKSFSVTPKPVVLKT